MIRSHLFKIKNFKKYFFRMTETEKWNRLKNQLQTMKFAEVEQNQLRIGFQWLISDSVMTHTVWLINPKSGSLNLFHFQMGLFVFYFLVLMWQNIPKVQIWIMSILIHFIAPTIWPIGIHFCHHTRPMTKRLIFRPPWPTSLKKW